MRYRKTALLIAAVVLTGVRCAHEPLTPEQAACRARVDRCMESCDEEPAHEPTFENESGGCDSSTQSPCEERCYEHCW